MSKWLSRGSVLLAALFVVLAIGLPIAAVAARVVELDAAGLPEGPVNAWQNKGALKGAFESVSIGGAVVDTVDGRRAVTFDGGRSFFKSSFAAPAAITGSKPFTVAVWVYNPKIDGAEEPLVYWAHRGTDKKSAHLNYGNSTASGAVVHWGADLGFKGGVPEAGKWHLIAVTYAGGKDGQENVYVDGKVNASAKMSLDLFPGDPIYLGTTEFEKFFSGSLANVWMYDYALSADELAYLAGSGGSKPKAALVELSAKELPEGKIEKWANKGSAGGSFGLQSSAPSVKTVAGKKALNLDGRNWLQSSFSCNMLSGPFTVEYWAYRPQISEAAAPILSLGDQSVPELARFSYCSAGRDGAFSSGRTQMYFGDDTPAKAKWHHFAVSSSADGTKLYVDGELVKESKSGLAGAKPAKFQLGGAYPPNRGFPITAPQMAVSRVCVYDAALSQAEIRNNNGQFNAFAPTPASPGSTDGFTTELKWNEGAKDIKSCNVYFGTDEDAVASAEKSSKVFLKNVAAGTTSIPKVDIDLAQTYYWRVDEIGADGKVKYRGDLWSFGSEPGTAAEPKPRTMVAGVQASTNTLKWIPGNYASEQTVYLSTDKAAVESGSAVIAKNLKGTAGECKIPTALQPGQVYYWRVSNQNGKHPASKGEVWAFRTESQPQKDDITFYVGSDLHYGASPLVASSLRKTIDAMNWFPGTPYPPSVGGTVSSPRGIILTGDLTNSGSPEQWAQFCEDFSEVGNKRVAWPVYEVFGNHDGSLSPGAAPARGIIERNKTRIGVKKVSENGLHYSWDWGQVHFANLGLYAGDVRVKKGSMDGPGHEPQFSLQFLKDDLKENVGNSGRPVIISMHLGFDEGFSIGWGWWAEEERQAFLEAIKGYNVIGILYGHTHAAANYKWNGYDIYNCASMQRDPNPGEWMVFHITRDKITVAHRFVDHWGDVWTKPITGIK